MAWVSAIRFDCSATNHAIKVVYAQFCREESADRLRETDLLPVYGAAYRAGTSRTLSEASRTPLNCHRVAGGKKLRYVARI